MMELQLLEAFHHAWRGRLRFTLNGSEREGNSREPAPSQRLLQHPGKSRKVNPIFRTLALSQGNKLQTTCSLNQTIQTWVKCVGWKVTCHQCVFTGCPRKLQNETLQKDSKWKKEKHQNTPKMHWIFQRNKEGATWEEQKYPKGDPKTMSGDEYRPGFKAVNMLRRVGAHPWLERTWSTKHCIVQKNL